MIFNPKGLIVTFAGALVVWISLTTHTVAAADTALLIAWAAYIAMRSWRTSRTS